MRAGKSYLAGQADWKTKKERRICARCGLEEETLKHIFDRCPVIELSWRRIDPEVRDFGPEAKMFEQTKEGRIVLGKFFDLVSLHKINFPVKGESPHTRASQVLS